MQFISQFIIKFSHRKIGSDEFGNSYFEGRNGKRYIVYKGSAEASKIPAEWHGWIHYTTDIAPININTRKHSWQKIHLPNLTGTKNAYSPQVAKKNSSVAKEKKPYQSWHPLNPKF